jgi:hypothetical protein
VRGSLISMRGRELTSISSSVVTVSTVAHKTSSHGRVSSAARDSDRWLTRRGALRVPQITIACGRHGRHLRDDGRRRPSRRSRSALYGLDHPVCDRADGGVRRVATDREDETPPPIPSRPNATDARGTRADGPPGPRETRERGVSAAALAVKMCGEHGPRQKGRA